MFRCYCCEGIAEETFNHLLLIAPIVFSLRKQFATCAGIKIEGEQLLNIMAKWWNFDYATKWKAIINVVPGIITCELWKGRNTAKHVRQVSFNQLYRNCLLIVYKMVRYTFSPLKKIPHKWEELVDLMQRWSTPLFY